MDRNTNSGSDEGCPLCGPLATPVIHEAGAWRTALNRNQNLLGKLIVVLRRHEERVSELSSAEWAELHAEIRWATDRLSRAFDPDHFNFAFLQNEDRHVHLHVIPRYASPRRVADLDFDDPEFPAHYRVPGLGRDLNREVLAVIAHALSGDRARLDIGGEPRLPSQATTEDGDDRDE